MRFGVVLAVACGLVARAQAPTPGNGSTQETPPVFRTNVEMVMVPVVVRDAQGRAVGTLKAKDFELLDRGKPQTIARFSMETALKAPAARVAGDPGGGAAVSRPARFVAYVLDDLHTEFGDLVRVREAAWEHMRSSLGETDRAAVYTTSGQTRLEFTDDRDALHAALLKVIPRSMAARHALDCPDLSHYQADRIMNLNDPTAFRTAVQETMQCARLSPREGKTAEVLARAAATRVWAMGNQASRTALDMLRNMVRRMATTPGQRVILLASPGFLPGSNRTEPSAIIDEAVRANITLNALDARGLWTDSTFDASRRGFDQTIVTEKTRIEREAQSTSADVLADLASGTGGKFFENNNDLAGGFRALADTPEYLYVLGFSPQDLKPDRSFHPLKVTVKGRGLTVTARRGYYASMQAGKPGRVGGDAMRDAIFSRDEVREFPVQLTAEFVKTTAGADELRLTARVELKGLHFREEAGRLRNTLTIRGAVFDRNGNYVTGAEGSAPVDVPPEALAKPAAFVAIKQSFPLKPGSYFVRMVVRDSEEQRVTAVNATVDAP